MEHSHYFFSYILSSDGTSQTYGSIGYKLSLEEREFFVNLDNDDMYLIATDKYRTTKGRIGFTKYTKENTHTFSIGFYLWTGKLDKNLIENRDMERREQIYSLDVYGGEYSHGIAELSYTYNNFKFSLGWDSETIRDGIQNRWHYFYNRPRVPLVDRSDRLFIQITYAPPLLHY